jgi:hypothetical protein
MFFAGIFDVVILPYGMISLGLTVWIIYTADHLLDARKIKHPASTERHRFHQRYFKKLFVLLVVAFVLDVTQLFFIRATVFVEGLGLAFLIALYFLLQRHLKFLKELTGALLYTGGVLLIPLSVKNTSLNSTQVILITQFIITALINLLLFSWFGRSQDEQDNHSSFATTMGWDATKNFLMLLFFLQGGLTFIQLMSENAMAVVVLVLMNALLLLIFIFRKYFQESDRYRLLGDAVFFVPLIYVFDLA